MKEKPKDVDAYIADAAKEAVPLLNQIRKLIRSAVPKAEEGISWNVPFYKYCGALAGFAVFKSHVGIGFANGVVASEDRQRLEKKGYSTGMRTIQIKFDQKLPATEIKHILKSKAHANEVKKSVKNKR